MKALVGKMKSPGAPTKAVTRDDIPDSALEDELRKRRGGAADILTGPSGAEAGATGKTILG